MGRKILLIEDDRETASYLTKGLNQEGHGVEQATNGQDGLFRATDGSFDLIILDRMLPVLDGLSVLKALRAARIDTPILILSALASVGDRIEGLECGSDDYLVKPFSFAELLARVNALLRRRESRIDPAEHRLTVGDLEIDPLSRTVKRAGKKLDLKPREYLLLEYFARNEGRVVTRTMLLEQVWDYHFDPGTNVIDVHVSRLRRKLDSLSAHLRPLQEGYHNGLVRLHGQTTPREAALVVHRLPNRQWLVSGRLAGEALAIRDTLERSLLIALLVAGLLGLMCGLILAHYVGQRIGDIAKVANRISARDLSQRVPVSRARDAFDRLGLQIKAMVDRISTLMEELRLLTDSLAHDLRSPVSRLRSAAHAAAQASDPAEQEELLGSVIRQADSLMRILTTVLEISRSEALTGR